MREYIDSFLKYLVVEKGFSKNTEEAYRNDLSQLEIFVVFGLAKILRAEKFGQADQLGACDGYYLGGFDSVLQQF